MHKEKGSAVLIVLILILVIGLGVAVYLIGQKTNLFPKAYFPSTQPKQTGSVNQEQYQNPFDESSSNDSSTNIFSGYQNPFEGLK